MCWGGAGSRPFVGREAVAWGSPDVCSTRQPFPPILLALTGFTRSGDTTVEPTDGNFLNPHFGP